MGYMSADERSVLRDRLRANLKKFYFSNGGIDELFETAPAGTLRFLDSLLVHELERREDARRSRIVKAAGFPVIKSLDDYDFSQIRMPQTLSIEEMTGLSFIKAKNSLIMYGICGSGKTMLSICLGMKACMQGYRVRFYTLSQLAFRLGKAKDEGRLDNLLRDLMLLDLLIIDEWGYCQLDKETSGLIYQVIADSYEKKSLIVTTNLPFSEWGKIVSDEQLAAAIIDRIVYYGHLVDTGKVDWRLRQSPMNKQIVEQR